MPDYYMKVISPDLANEKKFLEDYKNLPLFTKELKVSNLSQETLSRVIELNERILMFWRLKIFGYAKHLLAKRDLLLSSTSSFKMAERTLQHTTKMTSLEKIMPLGRDKNFLRKMLGRKGEESG